MNNKIFGLKTEQKGIKSLKPNIKKLWSNRKYQKVKILNQLEGMEIIGAIMKLILKKLLIILAPVFFGLIIIITIFYVIWGFLNPNLAQQNMTYVYHYLSINTKHQPLVTGNVVSWAIDAVMGVLFLIFIRPLLYLLTALQQIILFMAGGKLLDTFLFGEKNTFFHVPLFFLVIAGISIGLMSLFLIFKMIEVMNAKASVKAQKIRSGLTNTFISIIGIFLIPSIFIMLNTLINGITLILLTNSKVDTTDLGLIIFNSSFMDGMKDFTVVPKSWSFAGNENFSYLICMLALGFMCYATFLINILLMWRVFELVILYCISPFPVVSSIHDEGKRFYAWKEVTIQRFINVTIVFLAYTVFLNSLSVISQVSTLITDNWAQPIFVLIGIFGGATVVIKAPTMLAGVLGNSSTALTDGLSNIMGMKALAGGLKTGIGTALLGNKAKNQMRYRRNGQNANWFNTRGGAVGAIRGLTTGAAKYTGHVKKANNKVLAAAGITAATSLATKFKKSIKGNYDSESSERRNAINNSLVDNIVNSATKLKAINDPKNKDKTKNKKP